MPISSVVQPIRKPSVPSHDESWKVIVLNDNHNTFHRVAQVLAKHIPSTSLNDGFRFAETIHNEGQAIVWTGLLEIAEHYHQRLSLEGLTMAPIEKC